MQGVFDDPDAVFAGRLRLKQPSSGKPMVAIAKITVPQPIGEKRVAFHHLNWQAYQQILQALGESRSARLISKISLGWPDARSIFRTIPHRTWW